MEEDLLLLVLICVAFPYDHYQVWLQPVCNKKEKIQISYRYYKCISYHISAGLACHKLLPQDVVRWHLVFLETSSHTLESMLPLVGPLLVPLLALSLLYQEGALPFAQLVSLQSWIWVQAVAYLW
jgi:hypothetical protein